MAQLTYPSIQDTASAAIADQNSFTSSTKFADDKTLPGVDVPAAFAADESADDSRPGQLPKRLTIPGAEYRPSSNAADLLIESLENTN